MTQPPSLPLPPFGDATDEALNAQLDGELGAFAAEHDLTEAEARERLERWPEYAARIDALEQVRAAVRTPVPPLDDLTRRRLVHHALPAADGAASSPRSGRSWLRITAAAAAALILLAGVGAVINSVATNDGAVESSSGGGSAAVAGAPPSGDLGDLGDVSDPARLRALLDPELGSRTEEQFRAAPDTTSPGQESTTNDAGGDTALLPPTADGLSKRQAARPVTAQACAEQLAGARPVQFVATATYQGRPVVIVGLDLGGRTIASVVPDNDCTTVLTSISR